MLGTSAANLDYSLESPIVGPDSKRGATVMEFIEGTRLVTQDELAANDITRYHVTPFYREQIKKSGYYDQLKYIVEQSFQEFESQGSLVTRGEHDNTIVAGLT